MAYGGSLEAGIRSTSPDTSYLTFTGALEFRWYFVGSFGVSLVPVRVEGGPKVRGIAVDDTAPGVHGSVGSQFYLQAGSRLGLVLSAGLIDVLVQAPTLAWRTYPFDGGEIISLSLGFRTWPGE